VVSTESRSTPIGHRLGGALASSAGIAAFSLLGAVVIARTLGPVGKGELALLVLWPQLVSTLGNAGIDLGATYFSGDPARRRDVPATALRIAFVQSLVVVPVYLVLVPVLFRSSDLGLLPFAVAVLIPIDLAALYAAHALNGRHDYGAFNIARSVMAPVFGLGALALSAADVLTVGSAAALFIVANAAIAVVALALTGRRYGFGTYDGRLARSLGGYGLRAHFGRLSPQGLGFDLAIVALVLAPRDLGLFTAAASFLGVGRLVVTSVGLVVFPETRASHVAGTSNAAVGAMIAFAVVASGIVATGLWIAAGPLAVLVFGDGFRAAGKVAAILATGEVARACYVLLLEMLRGAGRPALTTSAEAVNWALFTGAVIAAASLGGLVTIATGIAVASFGSRAALLILGLRAGALGFLVGRAPASAPAGLST